jgi:hypothetical protein
MSTKSIGPKVTPSSDCPTGWDSEFDSQMAAPGKSIPQVKSGIPTSSPKSDHSGRKS